MPKKTLQRNDIVYFQKLWRRAQILGLQERDPDQVNTFLNRWVGMLRSGQSLPMEEARILANMLEAVLLGDDASKVFRPAPPNRERAGALGNDETLDDLLRLKRLDGTSHQMAIGDLQEELGMPGRTIENKISRTRKMNSLNVQRMESLAAKDAIQAWESEKFPDLEQACLHFAQRCGLDPIRLVEIAEILAPK